MSEMPFRKLPITLVGVGIGGQGVEPPGQGVEPPIRKIEDYKN